MQDPSDWAEWVWLSAGGALALAALVGFVLTFRDRVPKGARRCPKCKYDMLATPGMRCPECGQVAKNEKRLTSPVYRWRHLVWAVAAAVGAVYVVIVEDRKGEEWWALVPSTYLVLFADLEDDSPANTLLNRWWSSQRRMWWWQRRLALFRAPGAEVQDVTDYFKWRERWPPEFAPWIEASVPFDNGLPWFARRESVVWMSSDPSRTSDSQPQSWVWQVEGIRTSQGRAPFIELTEGEAQSSEHEIVVEIKDRFESTSRSVRRERVRLQLERVATLHEAIEPVNSETSTAEARQFWYAYWEGSTSLQIYRWNGVETRRGVVVGVRVEVLIDGNVVHSDRRFAWDGRYTTFSPMQGPLVAGADQSDSAIPAPVDRAGNIDSSRITVRVTGDGEASLMWLDAKRYWSGSFEAPLDEMLQRFEKEQEERAKRRAFSIQR